MKRLLLLGMAVVSVLGALWLFLSPASASQPKDCLAQQHVCISSDGRGLITEAQQAQLEQQIGRYDIYLVAAGSGSSGYNSAMSEIISTLNGHQQFTVGFLDTRLRHFGAYSKEMLPSPAAAEIATSVMRQHQADKNVFRALTDFVTEVQNESRLRLRLRLRRWCGEYPLAGAPDPSDYRRYCSRDRRAWPLRDRAPDP